MTLKCNQKDLMIMCLINILIFVLRFLIICQLYNNHFILKDHFQIARGNTILERTLENGKKELDLIIFALRKFSGGLGDEDSVDRNKNDWKNYFLKDIEETKYVISLQKANGEAAHMSCRFINDEFVLCVGSKNVHLVFKTKSFINTGN